ncbi:MULTISPECIES: H-type small acid-soluble spore protein [Bacillaceae]|uniref:Small, acid-soluble spore protein H n=1 Tax=Evansella alkalicola TaxID=745819 RepID=A0ABS6JN46_9BACI|nr:MULTISPECIES: H-type small acid-soluble spore protein [Bacillaceae]MBU9719981.1 H-type small acid-soluble spore protein [Bacillus alkalicola]
MEKQRIMEILDSPDMIKVTYEGKPVFIQQVDQNTENARVFPMDEPENQFNVEVTKLQEH